MAKPITEEELDGWEANAVAVQKEVNRTLDMETTDDDYGVLRLIAEVRRLQARVAELEGALTTAWREARELEANAD